MLNPLIHCDMHPIRSGKLQCRRCGFLWDRMLVRECPALKPAKKQTVKRTVQPAVDTVHPTMIGPGTELKAILRRFFITADDSCKCNQRANLMDEQGPDWCEEHIDHIVGWLEDEAKNRSLLTRVAFTKAGAKQLVKLAIRRARKKLGMLEQDQ